MTIISSTISGSFLLKLVCTDKYNFLKDQLSQLPDLGTVPISTTARCTFSVASLN